MTTRQDRTPYYIPHGTTEALDFVLRDIDSATTSETGDIIDLTGMTVTIDVLDRLGNAVTLAGTVSVPVGTDGVARYTPAAATDFDNYAAESPYQVRWNVSDGSTAFYVPNGEERDEWIVVA